MSNRPDQKICRCHSHIPSQPTHLAPTIGGEATLAEGYRTRGEVSQCWCSPSPLPPPPPRSTGMSRTSGYNYEQSEVTKALQYSVSHERAPLSSTLAVPARICQSTSSCRYAYYNMYGRSSDLFYNNMYVINLLGSTIHHNLSTKSRTTSRFNSSKDDPTHNYHVQSSW